VAEWLVALEATPARWDGALSAMAHQLKAVGEIRAEPSTSRYSVLVRRHEPDPADALTCAIADWQDARRLAGQDSRLLGVRIVMTPAGDDAGSVSPAPVSSSVGERVRGPVPGFRRRLSVVLGALAILLASWAVASAVGAGAHRPRVAVPAASQNQLTEGSMENAAGARRQFHTWGGAHLRFVDKPVADGHRAAAVLVSPGQQGGMWAEVPVRAGSAYEASAAVEVTSLADGSRIEMTLEWYDADHQLKGYKLLAVPGTDAALVRRVDQAVAPAGTTTARLAINTTQGGNFVIDAARIAPAS